MQTREITITLIGAGNVATQLGLTLKEAGYRIAQVYSPTKRSAQALAKKLKAASITSLSELASDSRIYIIAVKDDAIEKAAKKIRLRNDQILVHTSGTVSLKALKNSAGNTGVLYPLQTFSREKNLRFRNVPVCLEASSSHTLKDLFYFAKSISGNVLKVNEKQRRSIHLAAVFAGNFSNHMYAIAAGILKGQKLPQDILQPLIEETAEKIRTMPPLRAQTGPAIRGDKKTMAVHLKMLKKDKELVKMYQLVSKSIQKG